MDAFERKLHNVLKANSKAQQTQAALKDEAVELEGALERAKKRIAELEEELKLARTVGSIQGNGTDTAEAKDRINSMVREIDKCIALLNS